MVGPDGGPGGSDGGGNDDAGTDGGPIPCLHDPALMPCTPDGAELQEALPSGASRWKYEEATRLRDGANGNLLLSGVLAGAAGVLLATSFLLPSPEPAEQAPADGAR
ncbi:hypothetical protein NR798_37560 [Archangium gephyra]|uniref:hypothetical protein n=1 Tax=Archangium gephyra TaxID=48 RepID=UPI0035D44832